MRTQQIDVTYSFFSGQARFFHPDGDEFNGDLECPPAGRTFEFRQKRGQSGWLFADIDTVRLSGPTVGFSQTGGGAEINLVDPGNGTQPVSIYTYFLVLSTDDGNVRVDPKIKNTGGN